MMFYVLPATLTLGLTLDAVFNHPEGRRPSEDAWLLVGVITLLWPITLPCILLSQYKNHQVKRQKAQEEESDQYAIT